MHEASTQGFLETPTLKALAPTGSSPGQACCYQECSPDTRSYHSADCDTDHSLVCCKIRMQPKKFHRTKTKGNSHIDVSKMSQADLMEQFAQTFEKEFCALHAGDFHREAGSSAWHYVPLCFGYLWEEVLKIT